VRDPNNEAKTKFLRDLPGAAERLELVALDLENSDATVFAKVVEGVTLIAHTASPFPDKTPKHEDELIIPAVAGTVGILKAALNSTTIRRIVVTSSVAAVGSSSDGKLRGESDWTDLPTASPYPKSKTLAEKAAWDLWKENKPRWSLCTVNPAFVVGPCIGSEKTTSAELGIRLMSGSMPLAPHISFSIVDVRDVAQAHIRCLSLPDELVSGRRFILHRESKWLIDVCTVMQKVFHPIGYSFPKYEAPYLMMWVVGLFDPTIRMLLPSIGKSTEYDNTASREVLKIEYTSLEKSFADYGHALVYHNFVKKTPEYAPPRPDWTPATSL